LTSTQSEKKKIAEKSKKSLVSQAVERLVAEAVLGQKKEM
jgi:hypothetical protein